MNLHKLESENVEQFIWRLGQSKDSGVLNMSWDEIADIINKEIGNEDTPYSEAAFRKPYQQAKRYYDAGVFKELTNEEYAKELEYQRQELAKQQIKTRDERTELNRLIREQARRESYKDQVLRSISEHDCHPLSYDETKRFDGVIKSDNDLVISMTDLHAGIEIDNYFNKFNEDILRDRLNHYLDRIFEVQLRHGSENAYVILSELCSGIIHPTLRIENNQNLIEQFLTVTDYLSQFLAELSYRFEKVEVFVVPGNHSRISPNKEESLRGENIDLLALPYLSAKLQNFKNIEFIENDMEETIAMFSVRDKIVMASHGDRDDPKTVVQKFTLLFGVRPALVYLGHRHTNAMSTVYDTKVIQSGSLSSTDDYCLDKRLRNKAEQTISVVTKDGLDCLYDVKF